MYEKNILLSGYSKYKAVALFQNENKLLTSLSENAQEIKKKIVVSK